MLYRIKQPTVLVAIMGVVLMTTPSFAVVLTFTDLASWQAAVAGPTFLEDFEGATADDLFGTGSTTSPNGVLSLSADANFSNNALIDVTPYASDGADINGDVVVNMRFLDQGHGANAQEAVTVGLPVGVAAFAFEFNNYDSAGDGTFLSFAGTNGGTVPTFDTSVNGFFGVVDTDPGATISSFAFTGDPNTGTGFSAFNSFDDVRYPEFDSLKIRINTVTGFTELVNDSGTVFDIDSYLIESSTDDLDYSGWNSLSDQSIDSIDGLDPGSVAGDGIGETWDEAGGSDDGLLSESFLLGSSVFGTGRSESLGNAFKVGGDPNSLSFQYRRTDDGKVFDGVFEFVSTGPDADFDGDGSIDGSDFLTWQRGFGLAGQTDNSNGDADGNGTVEGLDLTGWETQYGTSPPNAVSAAVPEPSTGTLLALALATSILSFRKRRM